MAFDMESIKQILFKSGWWLLTGLIASIVAFTLFYVTKRIVGAGKQTAAAAATAPAAFDSRDTIAFNPVAGKVLDTASDMTVNAVLTGGMGPAVLMVYADWCVHCNIMMPVFEAAAARTGVPFVRIQGAAAPVTSQKQKIQGYPTILGVNKEGIVTRFQGVRNVDGLLAFVESLGGTVTQSAEAPAGSAAMPAPDGAAAPDTVVIVNE